VIGAEARAALQELLADRVAFETPLARLVALRIGGPADAVASPADRDELLALLRLCRAHGLPHHVLGAGFNTLVQDGGVDGVVIRLDRFRGLEECGDGTLRVEAGVSHATVTGYCQRRALSGLEFGVGIPGTMGGWTFMNAGIGSHEIKDVLVEAEVARGDGSEISVVAASALRPVYRALSALEPDAVLISARLRVAPDDPGRVRREMERLRARRAATQPLDLPSCGSVFKNPPGDHAGRLIEAAGLKGRREGAAQISTIHANFIVNHGGARARDVLALVAAARDEVRRRFRVALEPEVRVIGRPD